MLDVVARLEFRKGLYDDDKKKKLDSINSSSKRFTFIL